MQCDLKVVFSGFPLTCCCRGDARNRMCKATDRQNATAPVPTNSLTAGKTVPLANARRA